MRHDHIVGAISPVLAQVGDAESIEKIRKVLVKNEHMWADTVEAWQVYAGTSNNSDIHTMRAIHKNSNLPDCYCLKQISPMLAVDADYLIEHGCGGPKWNGYLWAHCHSVALMAEKSAGSATAVELAEERRLGQRQRRPFREAQGRPHAGQYGHPQHDWRNHDWQWHEHRAWQQQGWLQQTWQQPWGQAPSVEWH